MVLLWRDTQDDNDQFFGIVKTVLSFVQVLSFPSGRVKFFVSTQLEHFYEHMVTAVNTVSAQIFSSASMDCLFGKSVPSFFIELIGFGFVPILTGGLVLFV